MRIGIVFVLIYRRCTNTVAATAAVGIVSVASIYGDFKEFSGCDKS